MYTILEIKPVCAIGKVRWVWEVFDANGHSLANSGKKNYANKSNAFRAWERFKERVEKMDMFNTRLFVNGGEVKP